MYSVVRQLAARLSDCADTSLSSRMAVSVAGPRHCNPATRPLLISFVRCLSSSSPSGSLHGGETDGQTDPDWTSVPLNVFSASFYPPARLSALIFCSFPPRIGSRRGFVCRKEVRRLRRRRPVGLSSTRRRLLREITNPTRMRFIGRRTTKLASAASQSILLQYYIPSAIQTTSASVLYINLASQMRF